MRYSFSMDLAQEIALRVSTLSPEKQQEVFDFVTFLQTRIRIDATEQEEQPFRGMPVSYIDPTLPVAADDWEAAR